MTGPRDSSRIATIADGEHGSAEQQRDAGDRDVERAADHRVPSAASQAASVPWRSQSHRPAAGEAVVST